MESASCPATHLIILDGDLNARLIIIAVSKDTYVDLHCAHFFRIEPDIRKHVARNVYNRLYSRS